MGSRKSLNHYLFYLVFSLLWLSIACNEGSKADQNTNFEVVASTEHFTILQSDSTYILELSEFFQGSKAVEKYVLYPRGKAKPSHIKNVTHFIETPIRSIGINSTTHLGFLKELGKEQVISAAHNLSYAYDPDFNSALESGKVKLLGKNKIDRELVIEAKPEVLFGFAIDAASFKSLSSLRKVGQKVVFISEFMEDEPINKAAWIQVFAAFFGKKTLIAAQAKLSDIDKEYQRLKNLAKQQSNKPKVMIGLPWKGTWYVSGGNSFQAQFIKDANAEYLWSDQPQKASIPLAIETVFEKAIEANYWINPGPVKTLSEIKSRDQRFTAFQPFQEQEVYNQNKRMSFNGGNDYWESGVIKPELILADLIHIFHPELLVDHELYFYQNVSP